MKNKIIYILTIVLCTLSFMGLQAQNALTADVWDATIYPGQCEDGIIDLHINGGFPPYDVHWTGPWGLDKFVPGINGNNDGEDLSDLRPGTYNVTVTDALCGTAELSVEVGCEECPPLILGIAHHGFIECEGKKGKLTVWFTNDGVPPYDIEWSNGETTQTIDNLDPGYYGVTVTDSRGCEDEFGIDLYVRNPAIELIEDVDLIVVDNCKNSPPNGSVSFSNPFGPGYTYSWTGPNGYTSSSQDISNLPSGRYCVEVRDNNNPDCIYAKGCVRVGLTFGPPITLVDKKNVYLCEGHANQWGCDGSLTISVPQGATIQWLNVPNSNQTSSTTVTDLCAARSYTVEVCIDDCCRRESYEIECCIFIEEGEGVEDQIPPINVTGQANSTNGSITLTVTGGTTPIYYHWTGPNGYTSTNKNIYNLEPGTYCVRVFDGCSEDQECFEIVNCDEVNINVNGSVTNTCQGYSVGSISVSASGGNAPYRFSWSHGASGSSINGLDPGQYCVTVIDASGCESDEQCFTVSTNAIERDGCSFYCNGTLLYTLDSYYEYDNQDCRIIHWYCSDGYYLGWQNIGIADVNIDYFSCRADFICFNGEIFDSEFGFNCRDCIFFQDGSSIVSCHIDYCYFPDSDVSHVNSVQEHNSVTSIQIGEGLCNVEVWDDCTGQQLLDEFYDCDKVPFRDGDCFFYGISPGALFNGAFGNCDGFRNESDEQAMTSQSKYDIGDYLDLKKIDFDREAAYHAIAEYSIDQINLLYSEDCSDFALSLHSDMKGGAQVSFFNSNMELLYDVQAKVIGGSNKLYFESMNFGNDEIFVRVILPNENVLWEDISFGCSKTESSVKTQTVELEHLLFEVNPNPFSDVFTISVEGFDFNNESSYTMEVVSVMGQEVYNTVLTSSSLKVSAYQWHNGIYICIVKKDGKVIDSHRIIKQ